jgi:hypothetical protein
LPANSQYYWLLRAEANLSRRLFGNMLKMIATVEVEGGKRTGQLTGTVKARRDTTPKRSRRLELESIGRLAYTFMPMGSSNWKFTLKHL